MVPLWTDSSLFMMENKSLSLKISLPKENFCNTTMMWCLKVGCNAEIVANFLINVLLIIWEQANQQSFFIFEITL